MKSCWLFVIIAAILNLPPHKSMRIGLRLMSKIRSGAIWCGQTYCMEICFVIHLHILIIYSRIMCTNFVFYFYNIPKRTVCIFMYYSKCLQCAWLNIYIYGGRSLNNIGITIFSNGIFPKNNSAMHYKNHTSLQLSLTHVRFELTKQSNDFERWKVIMSCAECIYTCISHFKNWKKMF